MRSSCDERLEQLDRRGIADLGERLDGRGDRVRVGVREELAEQLAPRPGSGHLGEDVGQLRQRGRADRQALERALDARRRPP